MTNDLAIAGIQAILRLGQAGANLYIERANDKPVFLPSIKIPKTPRAGQLTTYLRKLSEAQIASHEEFRVVWNSDIRQIDISVMAVVEVAYVKMMQLRAEVEVAENDSSGATEDEKKTNSQLIAGGRLIEQWRADKKPPNAFSRMALTIVDVGLEFVVTKPELFGIDGKGEQFVVSFAEKLSACIPDDVMEFGNSTNFTDRVVAIFLRAGLGAISDNSGVIFDDPKIAKLVSGIVVPVVESLPENAAQQYTYRKTVDALLGPSAAAALNILAADTASYFGDDFESSVALGAVTTAMLKSAAQTTGTNTILDVFSKEGMVNIYGSVLKVAAEQPQLFLNTADDPPTAKQLYLQELVADIAETLADDPYFKGPIGSQLAASVIAITGKNAGALLELDPDKSWDKVTVQTIKNITTVISSNLTGQNKRMVLFGKQHRLQLGNIIVSEIALNPAMLTITDELSLKIVTAVATAMSEDTSLLLNDDEWLKIAAIAASTAVANQDLLLTNLDGNQRTVLLATLSGLLNAANTSWGDAEMPKLSFGKTLLNVIEVVVERVTNNISKVTQNPELIQQYFAGILAFVKVQGQVSSGALINLVSETIEDTLTTGDLPTNADLKGILS